MAEGLKHVVCRTDRAADLIEYLRVSASVQLVDFGYRGRGRRIMVLVDVYIPSVDETYDFMLDENTEVDKIILEIFEMVSKKIQSGRAGNASDFMLYHMNDNKALEKYRTLYMSGVRDGSRLMLV